MATNISPMVTSLRLYIGDVSSPNVYSDATLTQFIILAAQQTLGELTVVPNTFTIDITTSTIDPNPSADGSNQGLASLFILKAAVIIAMSEMRKDVAKFGVRIKDDLTSYDGTAALKGRQDAVKMFIENFEKTKWDWERGNKYAGRAILGPYESADLGYTTTNFTYYPEYGPSRR
jgi:hypothetical protein